MYKLGHLFGGTWSEHSFDSIFSRPKNDEGLQRIVAGIPGGNSKVFQRLVAMLEPPYFLLYVLHTPRGEGEPGRYQSPQISRHDFTDFIKEFGEFLSKDARFDIWAHSPKEQATVVWDRHNQIFAYGALSRFEAELKALGFAQGVVSVPDPHEHHYRSEFDEAAKEMLEVYEWSYSPLRPEDEQ